MARHMQGFPLLLLLLTVGGLSVWLVSGGFVQQQRPAEGDSGDADTLLFQITLNLDNGVQEVLRVNKGQDPLQAAAAKAVELSLNGDQTQAVLEAAKQYAQRARVLPVAELPIEVSGHDEVAINVFDGDSAEVLLAKIVDAGVPDSETDSALHDLLLRLQHLRVIPVTTASVGEGDSAVQIPIYYLDDVSKLAAEFASERGLDDAATGELRELLREAAVRHRALPIVRVGFTVEGRSAREEFLLFQGDVIKDAVLAYMTRMGYEGDSEVEEQLMTHATKLAAQGSSLPFFRHTPHLFDDEDAQERVPALAVFARDNLTEVVREYAAEQRMSEEQRVELMEAAVRSGQRLGVIPLLSLSVKVLQPTIEGEEGGSSVVPVVFELYDGEELGPTAERFCERYSLDSEGCRQLGDRATLLAQSEHILPVLTLKLEAATASGEPVEFVVKLFDGEDPARMAREASEAVGLNSTQADKVVNSVTRKAVEARLIPAVRLKLQNGDEERIFELWYGDNVTARVEEYSREVGLSRETAELLQRNAAWEAIEKRLTPLLSVPVRVRVGADAVEQQDVEVFEGGSIDAEVAAFATRYDLDEEGYRQVHELVTREAKVAGLIPLVTVAVNFTTSTPGLVGNLSVFYGDSAEDAVSRFLERRGLAAPLADSSTREELRELVAMEGVRQRVFPRYKAVHQAGGKDIAVELYEGDDVAVILSQLATNAGLPGDEALTFEQSVKLLASRVKALPALSVPVTLADGTNASVRLFVGDDIAQAVSDFAVEHGLDADSSKQLLLNVQRRAEIAKLVPLVSVPVVVEGGAAPVELQLHEGDNVKQAVSAFAKKHHIPNRVDELQRMLLDASHEQRVLPVHEVAVDVKQGNGTSRTAMFYLFKGEELEDAAAAFVKQHSLPHTSIPDLVTLLEEKISAQLTVSNATVPSTTEDHQPLLTVPVQVPDGSEARIRLFRGDNIGTVVSNFGREHGLNADVVKALTIEVQRRAETERLVPVVSVLVDATEDGGTGPLELTLFQGATVSEAVSAFVERHGLPAGRQPELERKLAMAGRERGVLPLHEVPLNVKNDDGSATDIVFYLYKHQKVEDAAAAFIAKHRLPESVLPDLLSLVAATIGAEGLPAPSPSETPSTRTDEL